MAISQGSNLINVVVHNGADSRGASLSAIILSHALVVGKGAGGLETGGLEGKGGNTCSQALESDSVAACVRKRLHHLLTPHPANAFLTGM